MRGNTHLSKKEIDSLVDQIAGSVNLTPGQWQSLRDIDVLMEVFDENEKKYLVAFSVSWTIAGKDVYSAIGHARSLRNVPGVQAVIPAISGRQISEELRKLCEAEQVYIHQLRKLY